MTNMTIVGELYELYELVFRFILQLVLADGFATLNIVETNAFKHLIHLSLKVLPGSNEAIKTFLSECLREYKVNGDLLNQLMPYSSF